MLDVSSDLYADGQLVASDVVVWLHINESLSHPGMFHIPASLEILPGSKYLLELNGEKAKLLNIEGQRAIDIVITEVTDRIAHFTPIVPVGVVSGKTLYDVLA